MTNPLLRAVQEYIDNESAYVRDVEGEIQTLHRQLNHARVRALRSAIAALYWRAGEAACDVADYVACGPEAESVVLRYATEGAAFITAAVRMEAAL